MTSVIVAFAGSSMDRADNQVLPGYAYLWCRHLTTLLEWRYLRAIPRSPLRSKKYRNPFHAAEVLNERQARISRSLSRSRAPTPSAFESTEADVDGESAVRSIKSENRPLKDKSFRWGNRTFVLRAAILASNRGARGGILDVARVALLLKITLLSNNEERRAPSTARSRGQIRPRNSL
jgi:hypothetical protein